MAQKCIRQNYSMRQKDIERIQWLSEALNLSKSEVIRLATIALADHIRLEKKIAEIGSYNVQYESKQKTSRQTDEGETARRPSSQDDLYYHDEDIRETLEIAKIDWVHISDEEYERWCKGL